MREVNNPSQQNEYSEQQQSRSMNHNQKMPPAAGSHHKRVPSKTDRGGNGLRHSQSLPKIMDENHTNNSQD